MKDKFFEYHPADLTPLWAGALICFDTNILLSVYEVSDSSCEEMMGLMEEIASKGRAWLPHQVGVEYYGRLHQVIMSQAESYAALASEIADVESKIKKIKSSRKHPFVSPEKTESFLEMAKDFKRELKKSRSELLNLLIENPKAERVAEIFKGRVGDSFSEEQLRSIEAEGEDRYNKQIPPGYHDSDKSNGGFGDLIIWKQLIKKAKLSRCDIVFVTNDLKDDWFLQVSGKGRTASPRPELIREFNDESGQRVHICTIEILNRQIKGYLDQDKALTGEAEEEIEKAASKGALSAPRNLSRVDYAHLANAIKNSIKTISKIEKNYDSSLNSSLSRSLSNNLKSNLYIDVLKQGAAAKRANDALDAQMLRGLGSATSRLVEDIALNSTTDVARLRFMRELAAHGIDHEIVERALENMRKGEDEDE